MSAKVFEKFRNTTFYDPDKFSKTLWEENNGPITEENLQIPDFYIQFFRNTDVRMDIDPDKFMYTINTILSGDNELLKIRTILLLFTFKNIMDIYPYLSMIITEDKIQNSDTGYFSDCDNFLTEKSKYFTDIFYNELIRHPSLMLDVIESIHYLISKISLQYDLIYPILNNIILSIEKTSVPVHPSQLNFYDENLINGYEDKIKEKYPLILPFSIKYSFFETANYPQKKSNLIITADREKVLDTVTSIYNKSEVINSIVHFNFLNEEDINIEASTREFFDVAFRSIVSPETDLFECRGNRYWFKYHKEKTTELLNVYRSIGFLLSLAVKNKITIPIRFSNIFYKKILHREIGSNDLTLFDQQLANSMSSIMNSEVTEDICLDFSYYDSLGKYVVDLKTFQDFTDDCSHEAEKLVDSNKFEYIKKLVSWVFDFSIKSEFEAFEEGFKINDINELFFSAFRIDEVDLIVSGAVVVDWNALKESAYYVSYDENSQVIIWFWKYFMDLDEEKKITVLKFVTGSSSIPTEGIGSIKIRFTRLKETDCLPSIHTCFKEILLPEYDSFDELKKKCNLTFTFL